MSFQLAQSAVDGRGSNFTLMNTKTNQREGVFAPAMAGTIFAALVASLVTALALFGQNIQVAVDQFLPNVVASHIRAAVINVLSKAFKALQAAGIAETVAVAKVWALATTVDPTTIATAAVRSHAIALMNGTDIAGQARLLQDFGFEQLAGVLEVGLLDKLPVDIAANARERYAVLRHIKVSGLQSGFSLQPSAASVLATGPDTDAAMAASEMSLAALKQRSKDIDTVANVLNNVLTIVAVASELSRDQAYSLLTTGRIDA